MFARIRSCPALLARLAAPRGSSRNDKPTTAHLNAKTKTGRQDWQPVFSLTPNANP
jgi:hypothetical protein